MNIGMTIKKYRKKRDLTQEQLSEYLNVSVSAVSQWESGKTLPDVSMLLALANFFDVTLDELFDRTSIDKEKEIDEYNKKDLEYDNQGEVGKQLALWREATQKYPGDFHCLNSLSHALLSTLYCGWNPNEIEGNAKECIAISERILRDCTDSNLRNSAIQILVLVYSYKDLPIANEEKAVEYALMAGNMVVCRESLLEHAYFTEESKEKRLSTKHTNILSFMDSLTENLYYGTYKSTEESIQACNAALTLWKTLIYDGNYLFYHCRVTKIYEMLARAYGKLGKEEETIDALKSALYHAKCFDTLPKDEQHYTSIFVNAASSDASKFSKNYTESDIDTVKEFMKSKVFDFLRHDERFLSLGK